MITATSNESKKDGKDQETIQSSTTPDTTSKRMNGSEENFVPIFKTLIQ